MLETCTKSSNTSELTTSAMVAALFILDGLSPHDKCFDLLRRNSFDKLCEQNNEDDSITTNQSNVEEGTQPLLIRIDDTIPRISRCVVHKN